MTLLVMEPMSVNITGPSNLSITMDCCNSVFINKEQAIVSLRNGDMLVVPYLLTACGNTLSTTPP